MPLSEYYGSPTSENIYEYHVNDRGEVCQRKNGIKSVSKRSIKAFFYDVFLPQGYPESVSADYLPYQIWDTIQAFCSSITGTLATQAVLKGSGVGDSTATAAAATITWLLKDGTGMVGRIAFAYMYGTSLDANAKQWRLFADVLNDFATFVQLLAPLFPKAYFTLIMCFSGLAYSLVGVAGGCTRAALTMHQAKRDNMADVSAKDGSQETLVNLAALVTSLFLTPLISGRPTLTWFLFFLFSFLHIYANYKAVSSVVMEVFNRIRFFSVANSFLSTRKYAFTPLQANRTESIFFPPDYSWLKLGCKLEDLNLSREVFHRFTATKSKPKYLIQLHPLSGTVSVALSNIATSEDIIRACYQSFLLKNDITEYSSEEESFVDALKAARWNLSTQQLCSDEWRWFDDESILRHKTVDKIA